MIRGSLVILSGTILVTSQPGLAQTPVASVAATTPMSTAARENSNNVQSDLVVGQNLKGPYQLGWKGIRPGSEVIIRGGVKLTRDTDYTFDPAAGLLVFTTPLRTEEMARITYRCDQPDSAPNTSPINNLLQLDLFQQGRNRATLLTQYQVGDSAAGPSVLPLLQFASGLTLSKKADLTSNFFFDLRGGDIWNRSGLRVAETTKLGFADLSFGYSRAGGGFVHEKQSGLAAGRERMEASGAFALARGLTLNSFLRQTTELRDTSQRSADQNFTERGTVTNEQGASLLVALRQGGKLEAGRTETRITPNDGDAVIKTQDTVKLDGTLNRTTQATVGFDTLTTRPMDDDTGTQTYSQTSSLEVRNRPNDRTLFTGGYRNIVGTDGVQDIAGLNVETSPFARQKQFKLRAGFEERYAQDGARRSRQALVDLPFARAQISGGVRMSSDPTSERRTGLLDAKVRPFRYVEFSGSARLRDGERDKAPDAELADTYDLSLSFSPMRQLRLTGGMAQNPGLGDTFKRSNLRSVGLETQFGSVALRGKYGIEDEYAQERMTQLAELALDLRLTRWNSISAGYQGRSVFSDDMSDSNTYLFSFKHDLSDVFNLSLGGSMTLYGKNGTVDKSQTELRGEAKVGIRFR